MSKQFIESTLIVSLVVIGMAALTWGLLTTGIVTTNPSVMKINSTIFKYNIQHAHIRMVGYVPELNTCGLTYGELPDEYVFREYFIPENVSCNDYYIKLWNNKSDYLNYRYKEVHGRKQE